MSKFTYTLTFQVEHTEDNPDMPTLNPNAMSQLMAEWAMAQDDTIEVTATGAYLTAIDTRQYRCLDCDAEFDTLDAMNTHINTEHNEGYGQ